jgi:hypothetical protein
MSGGEKAPMGPQVQLADLTKNAVNFERWEKGQLTSEDFHLLDLNGDSLVTTSEAKYNHLKPTIFDQLSGVDRQIEHPEWDYGVNNLQYKERWLKQDFQTADFQKLDYKKDGELSLDEWVRNGLSPTLFSRLAGSDSRISNNEWQYFVNTTLPNRERWFKGAFTTADFSRIDADQNDQISLGDWRRNGLSEQLFRQIAGNDKEIGAREWGDYISVVLPNQERWARKEFTPADFALLDHDHDNAISSDDWRRSGLPSSLFSQLAGDDKCIVASEWAYYLNTTLPNAVAWNNNQFTTADFARLDYDQNSLISQAEWRRNNLYSALFQKLAGDDKQIAAGEWGYFVNTSLPNSQRWDGNGFNAGDFARLDYDRNNVISQADWQRNGLSVSLFSQLAGDDKQVSTSEWGYFVNTTLPNTASWAGKSFQAGDFMRLDFDHNNFISQADWRRNGLSNSFFRQLSGPDNLVSVSEWNYYLNVTQANQRRWNFKEFSIADFALLDFDRNNLISQTDWKRNGLSGSLFSQVAGDDRLISSSEWSYLINTTLPNRLNWISDKFSLGDFARLDFDQNNAISQSDWRRNGLSSALFRQLAGADKQISGSEWTYYLNVTQPNMPIWANWQLTFDQIRPIDVNGDGTITTDELSRNGLADDFLERISIRV